MPLPGVVIPALGYAVKKGKKLGIPGLGKGRSPYRRRRYRPLTQAQKADLSYVKSTLGKTAAAEFISARFR